jgi:capsular exopolysaccharide synthesis family protein
MSRLYETLTKVENGRSVSSSIDIAGSPATKTNGIPPEQPNGAEHPSTLQRYVEPIRMEAAPTPGYGNLRDYWEVIIRHKVTLMCFAVTGLVVAILFSLVQAPRYRARTSLEIQNFNENFMDLKSMDPTNSSTEHFSTADTYLDTQIQIMQSEALIERVLNRLNLQESRPSTHWWAFGALKRRMLGVPKSSRPPGKEEMIRQAESNLTVRSAANTRLLEVLYESPDSKLAADFANTLVSEFVQQSQDIRWKSTQLTVAWLTSHLDEMKAKLEKSEAEAQDYARTSGLTFTSEKDNVAGTRLKELQDELSAAQADSIAKRAKFEAAENKPVESLPIDDPVLRDDNQKLTDLQGQLAQLSATLTPAHFKVQRVQAQIDQLQLAMQKERDQIMHRIGNEYDAARRRENLLAKACAEQETIVLDKSSKAIHYETLKGDVDSNRQIYESMLQRVKQAELASAMRVSNVLVVDSAKPPLLPYKPNLPMNSAIGLFCGMFAGVVFVLIWGHFDRRILAPGEAQVFLNLPELGAIPMAEIDAETTSKRALASTSAPGESPELATWQRKVSLLAECFRATLTSLLLPAQNGGHPQVVLLTSPAVGDGKTMVTSNLGIAMAELGRKVVLIDGDVRRPRLHQVFGISNDWGLADLLSAKTPPQSIPLAELARETKVPGLCLLSSGTKTMTTSNLFHSSSMALLLERLRTEFDMILIDAPPMIWLADARVLGSIADGVVLVLRAGRTTHESALFAMQRFADDGTRVLGTILNNWDPKNIGSYNGYKDYAGIYDSREK